MESVARTDDLARGTKSRQTEQGSVVQLSRKSEGLRGQSILTNKAETRRDKSESAGTVKKDRIRSGFAVQNSEVTPKCVHPKPNVVVLASSTEIFLFGCPLVKSKTN